MHVSKLRYTGLRAAAFYPSRKWPNAASGRTRSQMITKGLIQGADDTLWWLRSLASPSRGSIVRGFTRGQCQTHDGPRIAALPYDLTAELARKGIDQSAAEPGIGPSR